MRDSLSLTPRAVHDLNQANEVIPQPGEELALRIDRACRADRPGWQISAIPPDRDRGRVWAPSLRIVRFDENNAEVCPEVEPLEAVLPAGLALLLETRHRLAWNALGRRDLAVGRFLQAAALRDLLNLQIASKRTDATVAAVCGYDNERHTHRALEHGRDLWRRLGAWPWWYFDRGKPPENWEAGTYSSVLRRAFLTWETGALIPPTRQTDA